MTDDLIVESDGAVLRITLNRPAVLNALREETVEGLVDVLTSIGRDRSVGVIVIAGAGRAFCSGFDANLMKDMTDQHMLELFFTRNLRLSTALRAVPQPVIAAVHGYCAGGGYELAMFCDLIVADETAIFYCTGVNSGSSPVWGGTQLLPANIGEKRAREQVYFASRQPAAEALGQGAINAVVPTGELRATVDDWCEQLLRMSPGGLRISKRAINMAIAGLQPMALESACEYSASSAGDELRDRFAAFVGKVDPS